MLSELPMLVRSANPQLIPHFPEEWIDDRLGTVDPLGSHGLHVGEGSSDHIAGGTHTLVWTQTAKLCQEKKLQQLWTAGELAGSGLGPWLKMRLVHVWGKPLWKICGRGPPSRSNQWWSRHGRLRLSEAG